ncbi:tetratricopeptide repeat protein, partial [Mycobacterium tuberculosis]|uniref:tetratricopeptide repeat protein n=1 Tax=Mycobacterium tuberculosis TaxID=1773 RepID=UPI00214DB4B4
MEYSRLPQPSKQESKDTITYLTRAINLGNDSVSVLRERAEAHMDLKEYDLAIADYTRCIKQDPEALQERALAYRDSGNLPAALKDLNEYMSLSKNNDAYQNRALVYVAMDDYKNALKDCSESIARMKVQRPGPYWN